MQQKIDLFKTEKGYINPAFIIRIKMKPNGKALIYFAQDIEENVAEVSEQELESLRRGAVNLVGPGSEDSE